MYDKKIEEVYKLLNSSKEGLSSSEVQKRLEKDGYNELIEKESKSKFSIFLEQFKDMMIIILIFVGIIMTIYGFLVDHDFTDPIVIFVVVFLNAIMGFLQEVKAEVTLEGLKNYIVKKSLVKRDGKLELIDSKDIVVGDIIVLQAGDRVAADARIIEVDNFFVDESALTGESVPIEKISRVIKSGNQIQDQFNMIFSSSNVTSGRCEAIVTATGMSTELGKIATSLNTPYKVETPLERKISEISKTITKLIFLILIFIFFYSVLTNSTLMEAIMLCASLAVAAIPEGLPAVITITLSNGTAALLKRKAVVRQMSAVETLGSINVICSDKTGTITQNKMHVVKDIVYNKEMLHYVFGLCNDTLIEDNEYIGDPTESCLYDYLRDNDVDVMDMRINHKRIISAPFDSDRKMMSTINFIDGKAYMFVKGSFSNVLNKCSHIGDKKTKLTEAKKKEISEMANNMAGEALRVMSYAYKVLDNTPKSSKAVLEEEKDLILCGVVGIIDPPRDSVKESVEQCKKASIRPIMITGDSLITACAIAKQVGIIEDEDEGILGSELDKYSDEELIEIVNKYNVYARVNPIHKLRIVHALQKQDLIVAMTGDGVNDAPAIKDANVGIGMGITGTDVTKNVSDVVLLEESFSTIVVAIKEGRRIFANIRNNVVYSLSSNIAELLIVITGMFTGNIILLPIHILFIDLITDSIPSIALSFEGAAKGIMNEKPNSVNKPIFTPFILSCIITSAIVESIMVLFVYFYTYKHISPTIAMEVALLSLVIQELVYAVTCRNLKTTIINQGLFSNKAMNISLIILIIVELIFFLTPVGSVISIEALSITNVLMVVLFNVFSFFIYEFLKPLLIKRFKD